jgi:hypothetical protein
VCLPACEEEATRFDAVYVRELPRRITPAIEILEEAFPQVAEACRRAGIATPVARIGIVLDEYEDEPDALTDEICRRSSSPFDLKLEFRDRGELARFLEAYEAAVRATLIR